MKKNGHKCQQPLRWGWKGLRNRYRPEHRISRGMVTAAPWVDTVLLIVFFLLCSLPFVLQPGIVVELPFTNIGNGHSFGHTMVVTLQLEAAGEESAREVVFFDDRYFLYGDQRDALRDALQRAVKKRPDLPLIIKADHNIRHGLLVELYTMAADIGVREVNVATKPF